MLNIKPSNIFIDEVTGGLVFSDFGVAAHIKNTVGSIGTINDVLFRQV